MELIFATQNQNKAKEIQSLLPNHITIKTLKEIGCEDDIPETSSTLEGNAHIKAAYIYKKYDVNCFADDTGLEIEVLNGEPGVYSARYSGSEKDSDKNVDLVLQKLKGNSQRKAQFRTVISLFIDGEEHQFEGIVEGKIKEERTGNDGFGYDPIFQPEGSTHTYAEMSLTEKNKTSHRSRAFAKLCAFLETI